MQTQPLETEQTRGQYIKALVKKIDDLVSSSKQGIGYFERLVADLAELNALVSHTDGAEIPSDIFHGVSNKLRSAMVAYWCRETIFSVRKTIQENADSTEKAKHANN